MDSPSGSDGKASVCNAGDQGSITGLGRSPGEGNGNPLQYSCLENCGQRSLTVYSPGVAKSWTRLLFLFFLWRSQNSFQFNSISRVWLFLTPWTSADQASLSSTASRSLLKFTSIETMMLILSSLPTSTFAFNLSQHQVFSNELTLQIRWPKYQHFSLSIRPSNEYSGLISIRIDRFDLFAVQGTLKSLFQHHSLKALYLMHAKSLQLCPTLCSPVDWSPPDSSVHGNSSGLNTRVGCHALLQGIFPPQGLMSSLLTSPALAAQFSSIAQSCPTLCDPWTTACQASLFITKFQSLLKFMFIESVMPSDHLILCCLLLLLHALI